MLFITKIDDIPTSSIFTKQVKRKIHRISFWVHIPISTAWYIAQRPRINFTAAFPILILIEILEKIQMFFPLKFLASILIEICKNSAVILFCDRNFWRSFMTSSPLKLINFSYRQRFCFLTGILIKILEEFHDNILYNIIIVYQTNQSVIKVSSFFAPYGNFQSCSLCVDLRSE